MPTAYPQSPERREVRSRSDALPLLYQGVFTGIVRLQAVRQQLSDPVAFRRRIKEALQDVQKEAALAGYSAREIRDAESAVVALLDETVLSLHDPARDRWASQPLSVELYGDANAGEVFFDRLDELRGETDSPGLADLLEVYLLCLLLGFEGRYSGPARAEAQLIADRLRSRIEGVRKENYRLSPPLRFVEGGPVTTPSRSENGWLWWLLGAVIVPPFLFLMYKISLGWRLDEFMSTLPVGK